MGSCTLLWGENRDENCSFVIGQKLMNQRDIQHTLHPQRNTNARLKKNLVSSLLFTVNVTHTSTFQGYRFSI